MLQALPKLSGWLKKKRLAECFRKLKCEQSKLDYGRFYLATKCEDLMTLNPDWKQIVWLFHMHHSSVDFEDHMVIHYLRWLQS